MISPRQRQQVLDLWKIFKSSSRSNPLTAAEQITYLIFLKQLEKFDEGRVAAGNPSVYGPLYNCHLEHHPRDKAGKAAQPITIRESATKSRKVSRCDGHETCRWSFIVQSAQAGEVSGTERRPSERRGAKPAAAVVLHNHLLSYVFPWLRALDNTLEQSAVADDWMILAASLMSDASFKFQSKEQAALRSAVKIVDGLFGKSPGEKDKNPGHIFENLLGEIGSHGDTGKVTTPRHIARFVVELLKPEPGQKVIDPAAGVGAFLISATEYVAAKDTDPSLLVREWDGTPSRVDGRSLTPKKRQPGKSLKGLDHDRTMLRILWMNLELRGVKNAGLVAGDSLSDALPPTESNSHDIVLLRTPLSPVMVEPSGLSKRRFVQNPRIKDALGKSEVLFTWLALDLLKAGGRACVIVPDTLLYGSSGATRELRRALLFENKLEAVISLPVEVFQPALSVKSSVLLFEKQEGALEPGDQPRSNRVWFYEVAADGYTLDAKREPKPEPNDLWDALAKWPQRVVNSKDYHQPKLDRVRWFTKEADEVVKQVREEQRGAIAELYRRYLYNSTQRDRELPPSYDRMLGRHGDEGLGGRFSGASTHVLDETFQAAMDQMLEQGQDSVARRELIGLMNEGRAWAYDLMQNNQYRFGHLLGGPGGSVLEMLSDWKGPVENIVREFAGLDGYYITKLSGQLNVQPDFLQETKSWSAPVRSFVRRDDWTSPDGSVQGNHDGEGKIRAEFLADPHIYNKDGTVKPEYLSLGCIEANELDLTAGRYKPTAWAERPKESPVEIIHELRDLERKINERLGGLLKMVEGRK